ncbi:MAG TPA: hypothetical protein VJ488_04365, partial [Dehalococcoidia bacterium]|nr:hypothetical protein [Dehalococcoidia bacterium]
MYKAESMSDTARVEQVVQALQRLKARVTLIESQYSVLSQDYARICEDALSIVEQLKSPAAAEGAEVHSASGQSHVPPAAAGKPATRMPLKKKRAAGSRKMAKTRKQKASTAISTAGPYFAAGDNMTAVINAPSDILHTDPEPGGPPAPEASSNEPETGLVCKTASDAEKLETYFSNYSSLEDILGFQQKGSGTSAGRKHIG